MLSTSFDAGGAGGRQPSISLQAERLQRESTDPVPVTSPRLVLCLSPSFSTTSNEPSELLLSSDLDIVFARGPNADEIREENLVSAAGLIVGTEPISSSDFAKATSLIVVAKHGAGVDNVDIEAATSSGVVVTRAVGTNANAVAELVFGLMLGLARGIVQRDREVRSGGWDLKVGHALEGATLGIVGIGHVGRSVASRATAFGMKVKVHDPYVDQSVRGLDDPWELTDLDSLLRGSDFVTIHVPLTAQTHGFISTNQIALMKRGAFLINTSRGGIIDEAALDAALISKHLGGAALDVFADEPLPKSSPLVRHGNVILTPHIGAYTDRAVTETSMATARSLVQALSGSFPSDAVNRPPRWRGVGIT